MLLIAAVFLRSVNSLLLAMTTILSIVVSFIGDSTLCKRRKAYSAGGLTMWGVQRDPILMVNTLIAIGLSVDFTSHILYHYDTHTCDSEKVNALCDLFSTFRQSLQEESSTGPQLTAEERRMHATLNTVALPLTQSSTASVVCILYLPLADAYVPDVFTKSIVLINTIGLAHAFVVLPVLMVLLHVRVSALLTQFLKRYTQA